VVLEGEVQVGCARKVGGHGWEAVVLTAHLPDDVARFVAVGVGIASDLVDGARVTSRDEVVAIRILVNSVDVEEIKAVGHA